MVKQTAVAGPIQRGMGVRLHTKMGEAGEAIIAKIAGGEVLGRGSMGGWHGSPPVDIIDYKNRLGYQVKVLTDPLHRVSFSGAHRGVKGMRIRGRPQYVGTPDDKIQDIRAWLERQDLEGVLVVIVLDEDANRATVHVKRGVSNLSIREMTPIGVIDNDTGTFHVPKFLRGGVEQEILPWPEHVEGLPRLPNIPEFLRSSTSGEVVPEIAGVRPLFRRPPVRVRQHRRRAQ